MPLFLVRECNIKNERNNLNDCTQTCNTALGVIIAIEIYKIFW